MRPKGKYQGVAELLPPENWRTWERAEQPAMPRHLAIGCVVAPMTVALAPFVFTALRLMPPASRQKVEFPKRVDFFAL